MFASVASGALAGGKVAQGWGEQGMASAVWVEAVGFEVCGREGEAVCGCEGFALCLPLWQVELLLVGKWRKGGVSKVWQALCGLRLWALRCVEEKAGWFVGVVFLCVKKMRHVGHGLL
ncbi:hypothetical protein MNL00_07030 [Bartonella krasnovii]|uniref:hypothetical protein n=1 Tax=Bartonella krasnovii TaxID=2267275 RepID=UPI001F4C7FA9|nr:hypothetical protein [Bartonella krasnovii]UNF55114.1 hypothetical protein MNL00_07030 [Bartonella krasnovii]